MKEGTGAFEDLNPKKVGTHQFSAPIREARPTQFPSFCMHLLHTGPMLSSVDVKMVRNSSTLKILTV